MGKKSPYKNPLVSVIIRTCNRPDLLKIALESVMEQTYSNVEIVVVEDGDNVSEKLVKDVCRGKRFIYEATGEKRGRSWAGNRGMELAHGKYLNFLDDDDAFMPNHIEVLTDALNNSEERAVYSVAEERQIKWNYNNIKKSKVKHKTVRFRQPFNLLLLFTMNYLPIQSVLFEKTLFDELGGFDETLDYMEDWDMWVRYAAKTNFRFIDKVTSYYHIPYRGEDKKRRTEILREQKAYIDKKHESYIVELSASRINKDMQYIIREYKNRGLLRYARMFFRAIFWGER